MSEEAAKIAKMLADHFERDAINMGDAIQQTMEASARVLVMVIGSILQHDSPKINSTEAAKNLLAGVREGWSRTTDLVEGMIKEAEEGKQQ